MWIDKLGWEQRGARVSKGQFWMQEGLCISRKESTATGTWDDLASCMCAHYSLYQQLVYSWSLKGMYFQMSAAGEAGIQGPD